MLFPLLCTPVASLMLCYSSGVVSMRIPFSCQSCQSFVNFIDLLKEGFDSTDFPLLPLFSVSLVSANLKNISSLLLTLYLLALLFDFFMQTQHHSRLFFSYNMVVQVYEVLSCALLQVAFFKISYVVFSLLFH